MAKRSIFSLMMIVLVAHRRVRVPVAAHRHRRHAHGQLAAPVDTVDSATASAIATGRAEAPHTTPAKARSGEAQGPRQRRPEARARRQRWTASRRRGPTPRQRTVVRTVKDDHRQRRRPRRPPATRRRPPRPIPARTRPHRRSRTTRSARTSPSSRTRRPATSPNLADPFGLDGEPGRPQRRRHRVLAAPGGPGPAGLGRRRREAATAPAAARAAAGDADDGGAARAGSSTTSACPPRRPRTTSRTTRSSSAAAGKLPNMNEFFLGWDREFPARPGDRTLAARCAAGPVVGAAPDGEPAGPDSDNTVGRRLHARVDHQRRPRRVHRPVRHPGRATSDLPDRDPLRPRDERQLVPMVRGAQRQPAGRVRAGVAPRPRPLHGARRDNAIWIWSPNVITARPSVRLAPLYPGDDYVDWLGHRRLLPAGLLRRPGEAEGTDVRQHLQRDAGGAAHRRVEADRAHRGGRHRDRRQQAGLDHQPLPGHGRQPATSSASCGSTTASTAPTGGSSRRARRQRIRRRGRQHPVRHRGRLRPR